MKTHSKLKGGCVPESTGVRGVSVSTFAQERLSNRYGSASLQPWDKGSDRANSRDSELQSLLRRSNNANTWSELASCDWFRWFSPITTFSCSYFKWNSSALFVAKGRLKMPKMDLSTCFQERPFSGHLFLPFPDDNKMSLMLWHIHCDSIIQSYSLVDNP